MKTSALTSALPTSAKSSTGRARLWMGRILWAIAVPFMLFDAVLHAVRPQFVIEASQKMGMNPNILLPLGLLQLAFVALYVIPRTRVLGCVFLTGYLGGAVAANVFFSTPVGFALAFAVMLWASLVLLHRDVSVSLGLERA